MRISRREQKEERQDRTAIDEGMDPIAKPTVDEDGEQERARRRHQGHGVSKLGWGHCQ
jgi:hypothetical protein